MFARLRGIPESHIKSAVQFEIERLDLKQHANKRCGNYRYYTCVYSNASTLELLPIHTYSKHLILQHWSFLLPAVCCLVFVCL